MNSVWVVTNSRQVTERINSLVDSGRLADANELYYLIQSFIEKIKSFCQGRGCGLLLAMPDRCIMQLSLSAAEDLPQIVESYMDMFNGKLAVGIGMQFHEAAEAAKRSVNTGEIEMFDPDSESRMFKGTSPNSVSAQSTIQLDPNIFDPEIPDDAEVEKPYQPKQPKRPEAVIRPSAEHEAKASQQLLNAMMHEIGFPVSGPQQPQRPQQEPRDLMEALNGGPIQGYQPQQTKQKEQAAPPKQSVSNEEQQSLEDEVDAAEKKAEEFNGKLAGLLANVKQQIPQIMGLAEKNPKAFNQAMNMIQKLIAVAHQRRRVSKSQESEIDKLEKAFRRNLRGHIGRKYVRYPVGTRIGRRKKVLINGREVWRLMASGQIKDSQGKPVSVRSSNARADGTRSGKNTND